MTESQKQFEEWIMRKFGAYTFFNNGGYTDSRVHAMWLAWQASREANK